MHLQLPKVYVREAKPKQMQNTEIGMYECSYSREPVDYRLMFLKLLKRIWAIPTGIVAGIVIVAGIYLAVKTASGKDYLVENVYYLNFANADDGSEFTWVNQYTWNEIADMGLFTDEALKACDGVLSTEDIRNMTTFELFSDYRYLHLRVITKDPSLSKKLAESYEKSLYTYTQEHKEFAEVVCEQHGEAEDVTNLRISEMVILGAVLGFAAVIVLLLAREAVDTSVYLPSTLERRFHITCLGALSMKEYEINCERLCKDKKVALMDVDGNQFEESILCATKTRNISNIVDGEMNEDPLSSDEILIVTVKAANKNGKKLERLLEQLTRSGVKVDALLLTGEDEKLIKRYYRG